MFHRFSCRWLAVNRKEKAEIEGLQATIEKMKVDHEQAAKKWKLSENRCVFDGSPSRRTRVSHPNLW